jgi:hypothetical protein
MTYYKVKPEHDNKRKHRMDPSCDIYIANELYTEREIGKYDLNKEYMDEVNVSRKKTYWFFGARFAFDEPACA